MAKDGNILLELNASLQDDISPKLENIKSETNKVKTAAKDAEPPLTKLPKGVTKNSDKAKISIEKLKKSIASLGSASKYTFAGITAGAGVAVKKYMEFEAGIRKVRTISGKSFEDIKRSAQELAVKYGISTTQILKGNYQLVSSMGDIAQAQEVLDTTAKLSIAGFTSYEEAMNGLVTVINGYKMSANEASRVADVLMTVQNRGVTTVGELQNSLSKVIPTATAVGVGFNDVAAAMATITSNKVGTDEAVTYLRNVLAELARSGTTASENFKKATGQDFITYIQQGHNLFEALNELQQEADHTGKTMYDMFSSSDAANGALNLVGDNAKKAADNLEAMNKAAGTTDEALKEIDKGGARAFAKLREQANKAMLEIGEALSPKVRELTDKLAEVNWNEVFSQKNIDTIIETGKQVAIVAGAIWGISKAVKAVEDSIAIAGGVKELLKLLGAGSIGAGASVMAVAGFGVYGAYQAYQRNLVAPDVKIKKDIKDLKNDERIQYFEAEIKKSEHKLNSLKREMNQVRGNRQNKVSLSLMQEEQRLKELTAQYEKLNAELNKPYSNDGYLSAPRGTKIPGYKEDNKTDGNTETNGKVESEEIKNFRAEIDKFYQNQPKIWELLGFNEQQKLEEKISFLKSAIKKSVELGATALTPGLKKELDVASNSLTLKIKKIDLTAAKKELEEKLKAIQGDGIVNLGKTGIDKDKAEYAAVNDFLDVVEKNSLELDKVAKEELESKRDRLKMSIKADNDKLKADKEYAEKVAGITRALDGLQDLNGGFAALASATGGSRMGGIANMFSGVTGIASAVKGFGNISSITGMFSGGMAGLGTGLSSIGAIASGVGAAVGLVSAVGGLFGGGKGKKQKAKIDANNKENEDLYKKQVSVMEQLTKAIQANSERIKVFSDRMLVDMAKNPTLSMLRGGNSNFGLMTQYMNEGKNFGMLNALEKGRKRYSKGWGRHGHKDTYTNVKVGTDGLLKYLGFDKSDVNLFSIDEMKQLDGVVDSLNHSTLRRVTGRNLTESNIEEWKKQIHEYVAQIRYLEKEQNDLFRGATLESFIGVQYKDEKELIKDYTEQFKQMGLTGEYYNDVIKEMAKNNQVLITSMQDVRGSTIESFMTGEGNFLTSAKSYFEKIYRNASSVVYDVAFSDIDRYMSEAFEDISNKLVDIKNSGKLDFSNLLTGFDFNILIQADATQKQAQKALDVLKEQLLNSGVDLSIINQILPLSDFNDRINALKNSLASAMTNGLQEHSFFDFTKSLGESLYDSTKSALVKAFSESNLYQGMIQKFIKAEDFQAQLDKAGSFKEAFKLSEDIMKKFGYEMEAAGFGGFDAINNRQEKRADLGNAYYTDRSNTVSINITNNFNREVYGIDDFKGVIRETTQTSIQEFMNRPKVLA